MMDPRFEAAVQCETRQNDQSVTEKHWNTVARNGAMSENMNLQNYPNSFAADAYRDGLSITPSEHPAPRVHRRYPDRCRHVKQQGGTTSAHRFVVSPDAVVPG